VGRKGDGQDLFLEKKNAPVLREIGEKVDVLFHQEREGNARNQLKKLRTFRDKI